MSKPIKDGWNQHLNKLNSSDYSRSLKVSLIQVEAPFAGITKHIKHVHPYWQMGVVEQKSCSVKFENEIITPKAGDILLIPPQNWHYFDFEHGKQAWTIKFTLDENDEKFKPGIVKSTEEIKLLSKCLLEVLTKDDERTRSRSVLIEHLISTILDLHFLSQGIHGNDSDSIIKVRAIIDEKLQQGHAIKVEYIAKKLGFTPAYVTRLVKKQMGVSLKVYIDQQRFVIAKKLLLYSDLNITEVAEDMGFDDLFRFSRFFKRMNGKSPRTYLKNQDSDIV